MEFKPSYFEKFVTPNFRYSEFLTSCNHSDMLPALRNDFVASRFTHTVRLGIVAYFLECLRSYIGKPLFITSGFRNTLLNAAVGGAANSDHKKMLAVDFSLVPYDDSTRFKIRRFIELHCCFFRYFEFHDSYVHLSFHDFFKDLL